MKTMTTLSAGTEKYQGSPESVVCVAAAVAALLWMWLGRTVRDLVLSVSSTLLNAAESLTAGWASPPLPKELPEPRGLPFLGYLPFIGQLPHKTLATLAERYGGRLFGLTVGCRRFVVVSRIETLRQLSSRFANQLRGKPRTFTTSQMTVGAHNDMLQRWKRRRGFTDAGLRHIQKMTNGDIMHDEVTELVDYLTSVAGRGPVDARHDVSLAVARTMYRLAYGRRPDESALDSLRRLVHSLPDYTTATGSLSWFDVLPAWRRVRRSVLQRFLDFNRATSAFCSRQKRHNVDQLRDDDDNDVPATSLFEFFRRKLNRMSAEERDRYALSDDVLFDGLEDIIRAGTESPSLVIQWFLLYIAAYPEVQQRMRAELDKVDGPLTVDVVRALPYCRAAFAETMRFCSLNPFLKRELTDDIQLEDGLQLPRGTVLLFNSWAINNDRCHWKDPEQFSPERFLKADGQFDADKMSLFVPFGFGKRRCVGDETGRGLCVLAAAAVVQRFHAQLDVAEPDLEPVFGIGLAPRPYRLRLDVRRVDFPDSPQ